MMPTQEYFATFGGGLAKRQTSGEAISSDTASAYIVVLEFYHC